MDKNKTIKSLIRRNRTRIERDSSRVICRAYIPGEIVRINRVINRVLQLSEKKAGILLKDVYSNFYDRHKNIKQQLISHFAKISEYLPANTAVSDTKKMLIGAYFTMEYSITVYYEFTGYR